MPCESGEACEGGTCKPTICEPNATTCSGMYLSKCSASGTSSVELDYCNYDEVCSQEEEACLPITCTPGSPSCDGNTIRTCNGEGTGFVGVGTDCSATAKACYSGSCQPVVCEGNYDCDGPNLYSCEYNGTARVLNRTCKAAALCDENAGRCNAPVCDPGAFVCNGDVATRCKSDGSGYVAGGKDCAADGQACDGGGCLPIICEAGEYYCSGGNPQRCGAHGTTTTQTSTCYSYSFCEDGYQFCRSDVCTANTPICDGNVATTCKSDGSGPSAGGTDCGNNTCEQGECNPVVCTAGTSKCVGEAVYTCNGNGTGYSLTSTCASNSFCAADGDAAQCAADICTPNSTGCDGETIATCKANGSGWENQSTDCSASSMLCASGACASSEVGTQGTNYYSTSLTGDTRLTGFTVAAPRDLQDIQIYGSIAGTIKLTWVVYEMREDGTNNYDLVYQKVTAKSQPVAGWITSGALDFTFELGKRYAIGVHSEGTMTIYYRSSSYTTLPQVSFSYYPAAYTHSPTPSTQPAGAILPSSTSSYFYMRYTTVVPN